MRRRGEGGQVLHLTLWACFCEVWTLLSLSSSGLCVCEFASWSCRALDAESLLVLACCFPLLLFAFPKMRWLGTALPTVLASVYGPCTGKKLEAPGAVHAGVAWHCAPLMCQDRNQRYEGFQYNVI